MCALLSRLGFPSDDDTEMSILSSITGKEG